MAGRRSWVSDRRGGGMEEEGEEEVEESAMLEPLGQSRGTGRRLRAGAKRRRNLYIAVGSFSFFIMLYIIVASVASSGWEAANSMCQRLGGDMTPENRMEDWVPFISAVSKIYLQLGRSKLPDVNLLDVAKKCAASGWKDDCGKEVFSSHRNLHQTVEHIERERELLRTEFDKHAARWRPVGQELRLPAGFSLEYKKAMARAELQVCQMPPTDDDCVRAREEEIQAIKVLHAELYKVVYSIVNKGLSDHEDMSASRDFLLLTKIAKLIHQQNAQDTIRQQDWHQLNALSSVVLRESLQRAEQSSERFHDAMLYPSTGEIMYLGGFKDFRFEGKGTLFSKAGKELYTGSWKDGRMHGKGKLRDYGGRVLWDGKFEEGAPKKPWYVW